MTGGSKSFRARLEGPEGSTCRRAQRSSRRLCQGQQRQSCYSGQFSTSLSILGRDTDEKRLITLDGCPDFIPQSFTSHVAELATHPYGCRVLQKTFECLTLDQTRDLLEEMHDNIIRFTNDSFGSESCLVFL